MKTVLTNEGITWKLTSKGQLLGYNERETVEYEFWVGNPPARDSEGYYLFVAVCDFAVAKGFLRQIPVYAVVNS